MTKKHEATSDPASAFADEALRLENQLCFALYTASRLLTRAYRPHLEKLGLTYPQYVALLVLWEADRDGEKLTVSALGERLHLDSGTLTPLLKRLEESGLVTRRRGTVDERRLEIGLTDAGRSLKRRAIDVPIGVLRDTGTPIAEVLELKDLLRAFIDRLDASQASQASPAE